MSTESNHFLLGCSRDLQVAYLAGLLEGEGCFINVAGSNTGGVAIKISMTDLDVLQAVHAVFGGSCSGEPRQPGTLGYKPMYSWYLCGRERVAELLEAVRPYMGGRRTGKIDEILAWIADSLDREAHCQKGHPFSETGFTLSSGKRRCRICYLVQRRAYYRRPEVQERRKAHEQKPDVKARKAERERERRARKRDAA